MPNGRGEAKEAMAATAEEVVVGMEAKNSYLATIGTHRARCSACSARCSA